MPCECGLVHRTLDGAPGAFAVGGVEADPVWKAGPRRFTAWAAKMLEGDETDRSLALTCCQIAVEIAKARALRRNRRGPRRSSEKDKIATKLKDGFAKMGLDFDKLSFSERLVELELLRNEFVHEGRVITKSQVHDAVKAANAAIAELEK
ncbi:MAG TPA: hypothetical protein VG055_23155 [Planctomycetaceae bacterium]|nr:hypothetical protein [Planctomycetaceae bacterium]